MTEKELRDFLNKEQQQRIEHLQRIKGLEKRLDELEEDRELVEIVKARSKEKGIKVNLEEL